MKNLDFVNFSPNPPSFTDFPLSLRCILNRKARPVHKIIVDLFNIVAEFSVLLTSADWIVERAVVYHPNMDKVEECYQHFREYSNFLYTGE